MEHEQSEHGILFVDDEAQTLKYFRRAFEKEFRIFSAASADEGIEILDKNSDCIAVLITDQRMPEKRGVELLKYARLEYPNIVRILTTGYTNLEEAIDAVNSGEIHRYITKPWDLSSLQLELRQSMQFFRLRNERDELLREKLSAKQRMDGVNRVRELIAMASGFTVTRNPMQAIRAFIEQIPVTGENSGSPNVSGWGQLTKELEKMSAVFSQMTTQLNENCGEPFSSLRLDTLLKNALSPLAEVGGLTVDIEKLGEFSIEANPQLLSLGVHSLVSWASRGADSATVSIGQSDLKERVEIQLTCSGGSWGETSILDFSPELLGAYFAVYHHSGALKIVNREKGVFTAAIDLPKAPQEQGSEAPGDLSWLEGVLPRFENW